MILLTGGAGLIGSAILWRLNELGRDDIVVVDDQGRFAGLVDIQDLPKFKVM